MNYRPICDTWFLARPKVKYYGAYPSGFLSRARALLGVTGEEPVLHVCSGLVRQYPFAGWGPQDRTLDLDAELDPPPDFVQSCLEPLPLGPWGAILADPPYSIEDAARYRPGALVFPLPSRLLSNCLNALPVGHRVGLLHRQIPRPPATAKLIAAVAVYVGFNNLARVYSVFERER